MIHFNIIHHIRLRPPKLLFPSHFPTKTLYELLLHNTCYIFCPSRPPRFDHSNYIWQEVQVMRLLIMQLHPSSYNFILLGSIHSPRQTVLRHPQSVFSLLCLRPSFPPVQNYRSCMSTNLTSKITICILRYWPSHIPQAFAAFGCECAHWLL
jgi:hypothetical protein